MTVLATNHQVLVSFQNKTTVLQQSAVSWDIDSHDSFLSYWSKRSKFPTQSLEITCWDLPFVSVRVKSGIRGGKGGFGTLLKGQARQAGAKLTTDFGACRDLQGRRLRHVNDEIKLRKWRDMQRREQSGEKVPDDELWKTPSGIYNWHLMTPTWADVSKKATQKIKRQFQQISKEAEKEMMLKKEREEAYKKSMTHYLDVAQATTEEIQGSIPDAIREGLANAASSRKRKRDLPLDVPSDDADPNSLVTLTGDLVLEESSGSSAVKLQSQSDFGTAVLMLDKVETGQTIWYYEVTLETGGLSQIGWASLMGNECFQPNNDLGDGVGDDAFSFAVDGSRGLKFHSGKEEKFNIEWKEGDRLGCWLNKETGEVSFSVNGKDAGIAFVADSALRKGLIPAFSCNQGQILHLHTKEADCKFFPKSNTVAVGELVIEVKSAGEKSLSDTEEVASSTNSTTLSHAAATEVTQTRKAPNTPVVPEYLDLNTFDSVEALEALGMDRLKAALMFLQVKCGGTLTERASRLFQLKGLPRSEYPTKVRAKGFVV
eukprot:Nitzschia sp. Nitz4//scaffold140_size61219//16450//18078//NITZ4_006435-RA/size61219-processed-gene-0.44-mRNA-1//1//CDS//3329536212//676//frame0